MALHVTDRTIASLPTPNENERQGDYWDDVLRGFGVRVSYGGRRAFVLRYRVKNRLRRLTLGPYPDLSVFEARRKAREVLGDVARGDDPAQDKQVRRDAETFRGLAQAYLEMAQKRHRSWKERRGSSTRICCQNSGIGCSSTSADATSAITSRRSRASKTAKVVSIGSR